jgi:ribosomal protein S18 acetylase RimI-like enzyme
MTLEPFDVEWLPQLMRWFPDAASTSVWGGPHFRYPFTGATFRKDTGIDALPTWMLLDDVRRMLGFGQYYVRVGRCHLGHLVVDPDVRGQGIGTRLIRELCHRGAPALGCDEFSLFVLPRNPSAVRLYRRLGFVETLYPEYLPSVEPMLYMVASGAAAAALRDRRALVS